MKRVKKTHYDFLHSSLDSTNIISLFHKGCIIPHWCNIAFLRSTRQFMGTPLLCWGVLSFFLHVPHLSPNLPLPFTIAFGVHHAEEGKQWTFDDTREWLEKHGIRFSTIALKKLINIYITYSKPDGTRFDPVTTSLQTLYMKINQQLEQITIPNIKNIEIFWALFPALEPPKDKKSRS